MTTIGVVCPKCGGFSAESVKHPQNLPAFLCRNCKLVLEPASFYKSHIQTTEWNEEEHGRDSETNKN